MGTPSICTCDIPSQRVRSPGQIDGGRGHFHMMCHWAGCGFQSLLSSTESSFFDRVLHFFMIY